VNKNAGKTRDGEKARNAVILRERRSDKSYVAREGGGLQRRPSRRFFRVLTLATFLFMCGTSTNGFCPLKFARRSALEALARNSRVEANSTGRFSAGGGPRGTRTIGDLNKKNAISLTAESFLTAITLARAPSKYRSRVIPTSCRGLSPDVARPLGATRLRASRSDRAFAGG